MLRTISKHVQLFLRGNFTYLLISLLVLFIIRPSQQGGVQYLAIWEFLLGLVFFVSIFNINHPFKIKVIALCLNVPALILDWSSLFFHQSNVLIMVSIILTILFLFVSVGSLLYNEILKAAPTIRSLMPVFCAFLMLGFGFGYLYLLAEYFDPGSMVLSANPIPTTFFHLRYLSDVMYFSFGNLVTVGAGGMSAVRTSTETIATLEAMTGQFYIAILVSRVVSIYSHMEIARMKGSHHR